MVDELYGRPRTRAWPRPRRKDRHPTNVFWTNWLQGITFLWKYQPANFQAQLMEATKGTPWMARDPFISAARGRAWSFSDQDGRTWYPKVVKQAVSQSLDSIGQLAGAMLFRLANGWEPVVAPTDTGKLLQSTGPDTLPEWVDPPSPGAALNAWSPISPPASAGSQDDEFQTPGAGVPTDWTEFDPGAIQTVSVDATGLVLALSAHSGDKWAGVYKAIPNGAFTIWVHAAVSGRNLAEVNLGLCLWQNAADSTKKLTTFGNRSQSNAGQLVERNWTNYTSFNGDQITALQQGNPVTEGWFRIRRTGTTYTFDFSRDGLGWMQLDSRTLSYVPTHFGPAANVVDSTAGLTARFNFFRYVATDVGIGGLMEGARV